MFFFCKPKPLTIHFFTHRDDIFLHAKPKKAVEVIPKWFKDLPNTEFSDDLTKPLIKLPNLKSCPGFSGLYQKGFMLPLWSDLNVEVNGDRWRYQFADLVSEANDHLPNDMVGLKTLDDYIHLKLMNPWVMTSDCDVDVIYTAPFWNNFGFNNIVVVPGAYSPFILNGHANINLFFKKQINRVVYEIPFGQPLVHVVPVTERKLKIKYELVTEAELKKLTSQTGLYLFFKHRYNKIRKLCPHA